LDALGARAHLEEHISVSRLDGIPLLPFLLVEMMLLGIIFTGAVALKTEPIPLLDHFETVHIMAVAAAHIPMVHLALGEGAVNIDLIQDLSVREIELFGQQAGEHAVQQSPLRG
jgi:hypothetical protein